MIVNKLSYKAGSIISNNLNNHNSLLGIKTKRNKKFGITQDSKKIEKMKLKLIHISPDFIDANTIIGENHTLTLIFESTNFQNFDISKIENLKIFLNDVELENYEYVNLTTIIFKRNILNLIFS